jgi:ketosteroid isomerase-like protein
VPAANVDFVRSIYADWERGDFSSVEWAHPSIEFVVVGGPDPGTWTGLADMADVWRDFLSAWDDWRTEPDEFRELDDERVLVLIHSSAARAKSTGLDLGEVHREAANLLHVRDGKVTRLVLYWDRERALADLGIAPEAGATGP